jgi:hypothetical protein
VDTVSLGHLWPLARVSPTLPPMAPLPALMHATQVARPLHTKGWVYEEKYDGWRMLALKWFKVKRPTYRVEERGWDRNKS